MAEVTSSALSASSAGTLARFILEASGSLEEARRIVSQVKEEACRLDAHPGPVIDDTDDLSSLKSKKTVPTDECDTLLLTARSLAEEALKRTKALNTSTTRTPHLQYQNEDLRNLKRRTLEIPKCLHFRSIGSVSTVEGHVDDEPQTDDDEVDSGDEIMGEASEDEMTVCQTKRPAIVPKLSLSNNEPEPMPPSVTEAGNAASVFCDALEAFANCVRSDMRAILEVHRKQKKMTITMLRDLQNAMALRDSALSENENLDERLRLMETVMSARKSHEEWQNSAAAQRSPILELTPDNREIEGVETRDLENMFVWLTGENLVTHRRQQHQQGLGSEPPAVRICTAECAMSPIIIQASSPLPSVSRRTRIVKHRSSGKCRRKETVLKMHGRGNKGMMSTRLQYRLWNSNKTPKTIGGTTLQTESNSASSVAPQTPLQRLCDLFPEVATATADDGGGDQGNDGDQRSDGDQKNDYQNGGDEENDDKHIHTESGGCEATPTISKHLETRRSSPWKYSNGPVIESLRKVEQQRKTRAKMRWLNDRDDSTALRNRVLKELEPCNDSSNSVVLEAQLFGLRTIEGLSKGKSRSTRTPPARQSHRMPPQTAAPERRKGECINMQQGANTNMSFKRHGVAYYPENNGGSSTTRRMVSSSNRNILQRITDWFRNFAQ